MDLIEFLRARLDEDEAAAQDTLDHTWGQSDVAPFAVYGSHKRIAVCADYQQAHHVARHDPARILADVAAKRSVMDAFLQRDAEGHEVSHMHATGLLLAIRRLAAVYADHPDYRQEWKP